MKLKRKSLLDEEEDDVVLEDDDTELDELDLSSKDDDLFDEDLNFDDFGMGSTQTPLEKHSDLLKSLTNFSGYLKETVNGWLGLTWNEEEKKYTANSNIKPLMNIYCASWCISFLKTYARQNNILTNISRDEYNILVEDIIDSVWINIGTRTEEFGIEGNGDVLRICTELEHAAQLVLMGAGEGKYTQFLSTVTQRNENFSGTQNPNFVNPYAMPRMNSQKKGFFGKMKSVLLGKQDGGVQQ